MAQEMAATRLNIIRQRQCRFTWRYFISQSIVLELIVIGVKDFTEDYSKDPGFYCREPAMLFRRGVSYKLHLGPFEIDGTPDTERISFWYAKDKDTVPPKKRSCSLRRSSNSIAVSLRVCMSSTVPGNYAKMIILMGQTLCGMRRRCSATWEQRAVAALRWWANPSCVLRRGHAFSDCTVKAPAEF